MKKKGLLIVLFLFVIGINISLFSQDRGVVVTEVGEDSVGERAGIRAGDILISWERPPNPPANPEGAQGMIESVFYWIMVETEQGPRGPVRLIGERDGKKIVFEIPVGQWKIKVRPWMTGSILQKYETGKAMIKGKELEKGIKTWHEVAQSAEAVKDNLLSCWIYIEIGNAWTKKMKLDEAHKAYQTALKDAEQSKNTIAQVEVWNATGKTFEKQNELEKTEEAFKSAMKILEEKLGDSLSLAKSLNNLGALANQRGDLDTAETYHKRALAIRERLAPDSLDMAGSLNDLGIVTIKRGNIETAESYFKRALEIREKVAPDSLAVSGSLNNLGNLARARGDLETAGKYYKRSLDIKEKIALDSLDVASSLNNLGIVAEMLGDLEKAATIHKRALAIRERLAPNSLHVAGSVNNLAIVAIKKGNLKVAESYFKRALDIWKKLAPESLSFAMSLSNLGILARQRGDLEKAESYQKRALAIRKKFAPGSLDVARSLTNLGNVVSDRGDLETAEAYYKQDLAILEKLVPESFEIAYSLGNLGTVARERGDLEKAEAFHRRALTILEKLAPDSIDVAISLCNLGSVTGERSDLEKTENYYKQALAIYEKVAPGSHHVGLILSNLGSVADERGDLEKAEALYKRALTIQEKLSPGSIHEANSFYALGKIHLKRNQLQLASDYLRRSIEALEVQISRLGGSQEIKAGFRAKSEIFYKDYIDVLIKLKKKKEAFHILELSRAQIFLTMLAERDLVFTADIPEELELARKQIAWEYDEIQGILGQLSPAKDQDEIDKLLTRLRELREEQTAIAEKIRKTSPRFASLQYPQPLDFPGVQTVLDPGTVMLSYSVGEEQSYLFVVTSDGSFWLHSLSIKEAELKDEVEKFRRLIRRGRAGLKIQEGLVVQGKRLYEMLIHPAAEVLKKSKRILIVPDGPLHVLPFGALVRNAETQARTSKKSGQDWQYLIEWKPLHMVVSATVYGELKKQRRVGETKQKGKILLAFGDPQYPSQEECKTEGLEDAVVRSMAARGYDLTPLSATRQEVSMIARIYGEQAEIYLRNEATEERAKAVRKDIQYIHFACHGLLDEQFPLNSGLALTIPLKPKEGQDNGILQAWEIFERVRIDADLVTLSACETGLGKEMGGEGLVGMTRAFQYAGARSVLASLWEVADITTAELMKQFYRYLRKGLTKDEALKKAQMDMILKPIKIKTQEAKIQKMDASHPFFWAAFQLIGDWR